jgi:glutamyl-tRNA reductase
MAALAARDLAARGVGALRILNRSLERASRLASLTGAEAGGLDSLAVGITRSDVVICSTGAAGTVIGPDTVREALAQRSDRSDRRVLFFLDLAVPRDVDPAVADLPRVRVADIDDVKEMLAEGGVAGEDVERARGIVVEEVKRFGAWRRAAKLAPLIQGLRDRGARIQAAELARVAPRLSGLSDREWAAVQALASGIVAKLLHDPIVRLKEQPGGAQDSLARAVAELFGIEPPPGP